MAHDEGHLTTEEISAYLDGELTSSEQDRLTQHLRSCSSCEQELHELRQTITLLKALPRPALPRTFTLTSDFSRLPDTPPLYTQDAEAEDKEEIATPIPHSHSRRSTHTRNGLRILSALAAIIGLFLLGSALLPLTPSYTDTATSTGYISKSAEVSPQHTPNVYLGTPDIESPHITNKPTQTQPMPDTYTNHWSILLFFDLHTELGRLALGLVLLLLGVIGLLVFRLPLRA